MKADFFKNKRVAIIGLGCHGEMVNDAKYLIKSGAYVSVYDLKSEARLKKHIVYLRSIGLANYVLGQIPEDDLLDMDLIILSHEYPRDSLFLEKAIQKNIPIEYPETLFFKISPPVILVQIIGSCGKATVASILSMMLTQVSGEQKERQLFVMDPESLDGIISNLKKIKRDDLVVLRVAEEMTRELYRLHISPYIAIFTTVLPKSAYDSSPFEILTYQTHNNFIVANDRVIDSIKESGFPTRAKMLRTKTSIIPENIQFESKGFHDKENASLAIQAAKLFRVSDEYISRCLKEWRPLRAHIEFVKKVRGIEFYNDSASIYPEATIAALVSLSANRNTTLIIGGSDKGSDYSNLYSTMKQYVHNIITLPGSGTMKERNKMSKEMKDINIIAAPNIEEAVRLAIDNTNKGEKIVFSPGFGARGDGTRRERGDRFVRAVKSLQ